MKLIVGLGNPGPEYKDTRHNAGFMVVEGLARQLRIKKQEYLHHAVIARANLKGEEILIAKPLTFMNLSGRAVRRMVYSYKVALPELIVVLDDMDLELGCLRFRARGGSGGHKGLQSIIDNLGTTDFPRLRIGIGRPEGEVIDYVLTRFAQGEEEIMESCIKQAVMALTTWATNGIEKAMNQYN